MQVKLLELALQWPEGLSVLDLRTWLVSQLQTYGKPIRWAITDVKLPLSGDSCREVRIEAVVIAS